MKIKYVLNFLLVLIPTAFLCMLFLDKYLYANDLIYFAGIGYVLTALFSYPLIKARAGSKQNDLRNIGGVLVTMDYKEYFIVNLLTFTITYLLSPVIVLFNYLPSLFKSSPKKGLVHKKTQDMAMPLVESYVPFKVLNGGRK